MFQGYSTQVNPASLDPVNPQFLMFSSATFFYGVDGFSSVQVPNYSGGNLLAGSDPGRVTLPSGAFRVAASSAVAVTLQVSAEPLALAGAQRRASARPGPWRTTSPRCASPRRPTRRRSCGPWPRLRRRSAP